MVKKTQLLSHSHLALSQTIAMSNEKMWYPILGHPNVSILPVATAPACGTRPLTLESRLQVEIEMSLFERLKFRLRHRAIGGGTASNEI